MKKKLCRLIAVALVISFLLPSLSFAANHDESVTLTSEEHMTGLPIPANANPAEVFNVQYAIGAEDTRTRGRFFCPTC